MDTNLLYNSRKRYFGIPKDYKNLCRFCLQAASKKIDKEIAKFYQFLTNLELVRDAEYPKSICSYCELLLQSAYKFRLSLIRIESQWARHFHYDFLNFLKRDDFFDEHMYHEIIFMQCDATVEVDRITADSRKTTSTNSFDPSVPLINENYQPLNEYARVRYRRIQTYQSTNFIQELDKQNDGSVSDSSSNDYINVNADYSSVTFDDEYVYHKLKRTVNKSLKRIKCVVVGNGGVGKTSFIRSYFENEFDEEYVPTASDIYNFDVEVNAKTVHVTLCDTAGQDYLHELRQFAYHDCNVVLLCFSVVQPESFHAIKCKWASAFCKKKAALLLVGTQSDLRSDSQTITKLQNQGLQPIQATAAWDLATLIGAEYIEISARNNLRVKYAFDTAIGCAYEMKYSKKSSFWKKLICFT